MGKRSIYLRDEVEQFLDQQARRLGVSTNEVIRRSLATVQQDTAVSTIEAEMTRSFSRAEARLERLFAALEVLAHELGFVSGAMRASVKKIEPTYQEGNALSERLSDIVGRLRTDQTFAENFFVRQGSGTNGGGKYGL